MLQIMLLDFKTMDEARFTAIRFNDLPGALARSRW